MVQCVSDLSRDFSNINRLALTATQEISQTQSLLEVAHMPHDTHIERCSCNRSNCHIEIVPLKDLKMKTKETKFEHDSADMFQRFDKPHRPQTIIFVTSKREAENLANVLQQMCTQETTIQADEITFFHADLDKQERKDRMRGFLEKAITVVVATSAFGTGVNFPNVRLIFHYTIPPNLVEYLQNIGRGGRDGELYECVMYFSYKSVHECGSVWLQGESASSVSTSWCTGFNQLRTRLTTEALCLTGKGKYSQMDAECSRAMLTAETMDAFEHATASVLSTAPKCKTWLRWWLNPLHACLIFPSFRTHMLNEDLRKFHTLPTTTNLCESNHRNYYRFLQVKHLPIVVAAFECFKYGKIQK
jgi:superfamily II DNA helicase RecQ